MERQQLGFFRKSVYALGDMTVNTVLASLGLVYVPYYLTQVAGLDAWLAGLVPLVGRFVDAFIDPLLGRLSDQTRWRAGRRRPFFLIGAIPLGLSFTSLWMQPPLADPTARFLYYCGAYCCMSVSLSVLAVPYLALLPEMARGYDARISLNTFRNIGALLGIFVAISIRPVATALGGGTPDFAAAGVVFGVFLTLPWFAVWAATFERPEFAERTSQESLLESLRTITRHRNFRRLVAMYLSARIAMDLMSALLILYFTYWIGRSRDFEIAMALFLGSVVLALPVWLRISKHYEKANLFAVGTLWWMGISSLFVLAQPDWPRWTLMLIPPLTALGYAVVDVMPWAMLGDVIDEDDLATGARREGLYNGAFMFLRTLGGAIAVFGLMSLLDVVGYVKGAEQSETVRQTIRALTMLAPLSFLALAFWFARGYPLTRAAHAEIARQLDERTGR